MIEACSGWGRRTLLRGSMIVFRYDTSRHDFRCWAQRALGEDLEHLHGAPHPLEKMWQRGRAYRERLEATIDQSFGELLAGFIHDVVNGVAGRVVSYQKKPAVRVALSNSTAISGFHRDIDWGQSPNARNIWIPMTNVWGNNSLWIETKPELGDFRPVRLDYGEALIFDGAHLGHGSVANDTGSTRVSIDVRFLTYGTTRC